MNEEIVSKCRVLLNAYKSGELGQTRMPEDSNPGFSDPEKRFVYFSLPMALNYQRNSYKLWEACLETFNDPETSVVFDVKTSAELTEDELRAYLTKYKVALQPNKHIATWKKIATTVNDNWSSFSKLVSSVDNDYLKLREVVQKDFKKGFPYLSGPKIFNYWSFILNSYCDASLKNSEFIEIAPDTHVTKCSVLLGVISEEEASFMTREKISERWRGVLHGSGITPIEMHPPLWFWSRNGFVFKL